MYHPTRQYILYCLCMNLYWKVCVCVYINIPCTIHQVFATQFIQYTIKQKKYNHINHKKTTTKLTISLEIALSVKLFKYYYNYNFQILGLGLDSTSITETSKPWPFFIVYDMCTVGLVCAIGRIYNQFLVVSLIILSFEKTQNCSVCNVQSIG
jgi:hypothetical protein